MAMLITYRRRGGGFALVGVAAVLTATVLAIATGVALLLVASAAGAVLLLARAVLRIWWRRPTEPRVTPWPQETIESVVVSDKG
jgi:hypothetical protein